MPMTSDGWLAICSTQDPLEQHYYRMCVVQNSVGQVAKFWHYIGDEPRPCPPKVYPAKRYFK